MKSYTNFISEAVKSVNAGTTYKYKPKTKDELIDAIKVEIELQGQKADLNCIDTSLITNMSDLFSVPFTKFTGDLSKWDVSNVTNMEAMFKNSKFNGDISNWNVSNVTDMTGMFWNSKFNGNISNWNVSNVKEMDCMFRESKFTGDLSNWDVSNVTNMTGMFSRSEFNGDISKWDVSNVTNMTGMFSENQNIVNLNLNNFDLTAKIKIDNIFYKCNNLETFILGNVIKFQLNGLSSLFNTNDRLKFIVYIDLYSGKANVLTRNNIAKNVDEVDNNIREMISEAIKDERNRFRLSGNWYTRKVVNEYEDYEIPYGTYYYKNNDQFLIFINNNRHITMYSNFDPKQFTL